MMEKKCYFGVVVFFCCCCRCWFFLPGNERGWFDLTGYQTPSDHAVQKVFSCRAPIHTSWECIHSILMKTPRKPCPCVLTLKIRPCYVLNDKSGIHHPDKGLCCWNILQVERKSHQPERGFDDEVNQLHICCKLTFFLQPEYKVLFSLNQDKFKRVLCSIKESSLQSASTANTLSFL